MRELDARVVPDRGRGRYDAPRPLWFLYGSVVGSLAGVALATAFFHLSGASRVVICLIAVVAFMAWQVLAWRWHRQHRIRRPN